MTLDDIIVKLVQNTAKSYSHKFTKYQKVRVIQDNSIGVVVDIIRSELNLNTFDYSKVYHVLHIVPDPICHTSEYVVKVYAEHMLEKIE